MAATIDARDGVREAMNDGHPPDSRRGHEFNSCRGRVCARREAMPKRTHLPRL